AADRLKGCVGGYGRTRFAVREWWQGQNYGLRCLAGRPDLLLKVHEVVWPTAANSLQLAPLLRGQDPAQIQVHRGVFTLQFSSRRQRLIDLRVNLAFIRNIGVEQVLKLQILLF